MLHIELLKAGKESDLHKILALIRGNGGLIMHAHIFLPGHLEPLMGFGVATFDDKLITENIG